MTPTQPTTRLGVQLFTMASMVAHDPDAALKLIAEKGYKEVEFFGLTPSAHLKLLHRGHRWPQRWALVAMLTLA